MSTHERERERRGARRAGRGTEMREGSYEVGTRSAGESGAERTVEVLAGRMTALEHAFRDFESMVPGLSVGVVGRVSGRDDLVHPVAGLEVRLQRPEGAAVSLYISANYGELTRWSEGASVANALREHFSVRLDEGYEWGDSAFPDAAGLAHDLLGYLQYNLDTLD